MTIATRPVAGDVYRNLITGRRFKVVGVPDDAVRLIPLDRASPSELRTPLRVSWHTFQEFYERGSQ